MTGNEIIAFTRFLIQETTAAFWTDPNILVCLNNSLKKYANRVNGSPNYYYLKSDSLSLTASTQYVALPSDFSGKAYYVTDDGNSDKPLKKIPFNQVDPNNTNDPESVCLVGSNIYFNSKPTTNKTYTLWYMGTPTAITANDTAIDFPVMHHALVAYDAAIPARIRGKEDYQDLAMERKILEDSFIDSLESNIEGIPAKIRDLHPIHADGY